MKKLLIVTILFAAVFLLFAEENALSTVISVDDAVILAADNNISLKRQRINLETLERKNKYAWAGISPSFDLGGGMQIPMEKKSQAADYSYSVTATVSLTLTPSLYSSIKDARLKYENGKTSYEEAVKQIELNVRKLFYSLLSTKESINLQRRNMETSRLRYENNRDKYNRGQLSELALLQSQYSYESQRPAIESAEIAYQNAIASFKQTLGLPQNVKIELAGSLSDAIPPDSFTVSQTVEELPAIKKLEKNIELQKNSLLNQRLSAYGPSIIGRYSYGKTGNSNSKGFEDLQTTGNSISISVSIPLDGYMPWSRNGQAIADLKAGIKDLELQLENEKTTAALNLQNSIKNIILKQSQMDMLNQNVELAQRAYDMTLTAYNHGSQDLLALQMASDSLLKARTDRESQIYNLICAVLDLENTLGIPFGSLGKE